MAGSGLPLGIVFQPTDDELVSYYLSHKVGGVSEEFYTGIVHDFDVYGEHEPWEIWQIFGGCNFKNSALGYDYEDLYFFTKLKKTSPKAKRNYRKVGSGTWKGQESGIKVYSDLYSDKKVVTGSKKRFHYENKNPNGQQEEGVSWIMFEYSLPSTTNSDYVLCQIRKKYPSSSPSVRDSACKRKLLEDAQETSSIDEPQQQRRRMETNTMHVEEDQHQQQQPHQPQPDVFPDDQMMILSDDDLAAINDFFTNYDGGSGQTNIFDHHQPLPSPPTPPIPPISVADYEEQNLINWFPKEQQYHPEMMEYWKFI